MLREGQWSTLFPVNPCLGKSCFATSKLREDQPILISDFQALVKGVHIGLNSVRAAICRRQVLL
jgi:hypothetical protein